MTCMKKTLVLMLTLALTLGGCVASLGGGKTENTQRPTLGQELKDLKEALEDGALTDEEYAEAKRKLLEERQDR